MQRIRHAVVTKANNLNITYESIQADFSIHRLIDAKAAIELDIDLVLRSCPFNLERICTIVLYH